MVHALNEISRVLTPGGVLIDVRPLLDSWPLEVAWSSGQQAAGYSTDLPGPLSDDAAANAAMASAAASGFQLELEESFPFFYYWDTPREMQDYLEENWEDVILVEDAAWARLKSLWASANADARVRIRMKMLITRYRKQG
jgi:hypothetical protein